MSVVFFLGMDAPKSNPPPPINRPSKPAVSPAVAARPPLDLPSDPRDTFVSLVVEPGFEKCNERLSESRQIMEFMGEFFKEYADIQLDCARRLQALTESSCAKFERSFVKKAWLGITGSTSSQQINEVGTVNEAWQSIREAVGRVATANHVCGTAIKENVVMSVNGYLDKTQEIANKTDSWGSRLADAMSNYVRKAEEAKNDYHNKARACRYQQKILEEAEKQSLIGGIARSAILTGSRMTKLKEAAEKARNDEVQSAKEYKEALELVARKQNELYTLRMPRVLADIQKQVEDRTVHLKGDLEKFVSINQQYVPLVLDAFASTTQTIQGINASIDSRVFVAQSMSSNSIPPVMEFVPFDSQSVVPGANIAESVVGDDNDEQPGPSTPSSSPPSEAPTKPVTTLESIVKDRSAAANFVAFLKEHEDEANAISVKFCADVEDFKKKSMDAKTIYETYLVENCPEKLELPASISGHLVNEILKENKDVAIFDEALNHLLPKIQHSDSFALWKKRDSPKNNVNNIEDPPKTDSVSSMSFTKSPRLEHNPNPSTPSIEKSPRMDRAPEKSQAPAALVLLETPDVDAINFDDDLGGSDDELLNKEANLDDVFMDDDQLSNIEL